jgi:hypothetical protein
MFRAVPTSLAAVLLLSVPATAAELILPQNRTAFYSAPVSRAGVTFPGEVIEFAIAGLKKDEKTTLEIVPVAKGLRSLSFEVKGDGSTILASLLAESLAPSSYTLKLGGKDAGTIHISSGVTTSTMLLSATVGNPKTAGSNFLLGNAFGFGLLDAKGMPSLDLRRRSSGMQAFDNAVRDNLPTVVYMYWSRSVRFLNIAAPGLGDSCPAESCPPCPARADCPTSRPGTAERGQGQS